MNSIAKLLILQTKHISLQYTYVDAIVSTVTITDKDSNGNVSWLGSNVTVTAVNKAATDINLTITDGSGNDITNNPLTVNRTYDNPTRQYTFTVHIPESTSVDITTYHFNIVCSTGTTKQLTVLQLGMELINLPDSLYDDTALVYNIVKSNGGDGAVVINNSAATLIKLYLDIPKAVHDLVTITNYTNKNSSGVTEVSRESYDDLLYVIIQLNRTNTSWNSFYGIIFAYGNVSRVLDVTQWAHVDGGMNQLASPVVSLYSHVQEDTYAKVLTVQLLPGIYKFECWGARGGTRNSSAVASYGKGGYSVGTYTTYTNLKVTIVAGCSGDILKPSSANNMPHNGGKGYLKYQHGGDASWICIGDTDDLYARVIVAGGGGSVGATSRGNYGGYGGGLTGQIRTNGLGTGGYGGTLTGVADSSWLTTTRSTMNSIKASAYAGFGFGGNGVYRANGYGGAGGGGWYGGSGTYPDSSADNDRGGGGGSGYVYTKDTASNYPSGCKLTSAHYLTDALTIAGNSSMPSWSSTGTITGNGDHGAVRITKTHEYVEAYDASIPMPERLSYIENTGTGAIHLTNWYPSGEDYSVSFSLLNGTQTGTTVSYFGGRSETGKYGIALWLVDGKWRFDYSSTHTDNGTVTANEEKTGTILNNGSTFTSNSYCTIFAVHTNKVLDSRYTRYKFKSLNVYREEPGRSYCAHSYVPAKNHEGIFGVMDTEAGGFYYDINNGNKYITGA